MKVTNLTQSLYCYWGKLLLILVLLLSKALPSFSQVPCNPVAEFTYISPAFCQNGIDPVPMHATGVNGVYSYTVGTGGPFLSLNPGTGVVDLSASNPGIFNVTNTVSVVGGPVTCTRQIEIVAPPLADAGPNQMVCENEVVTLAATGNGSWSGGAGLFSNINSPTSTYMPTAAEAGTSVLLTWTIPVQGGVCTSASDIVAITILEEADAQFSYNNSLFCPYGLTNPVVNHTTGTDGIYTYGVISGGPFLDLNPATGGINLLTSDVGTYGVTNTVSGTVCPNDVFTVQIIINDFVAPVINCPQNITVTLQAGLCETAVQLSGVTATDNCDPTPDISQIGGIPFGSYFPIGVNPVVVAATDTVGNSSACTFDVIVLEFPFPSQSLVCNTQVQVTIQQDGTAFINADMVLEGGPYGCYDDYIVTITNDTGFVFMNVVTCDEIGNQLIVKVMDTDSGNSCWGEILLEDKTPPVIICQDWIVACTVAVDTLAEPIVFDNCDTNPTIELAGITPIELDVCDDNIVRFKRTWYSTDKYGNTSGPCIEIISIERPLEVDFPTDIQWQCHQYATRPQIVNPTPLRSNIVDTDLTTEIIEVGPNISLNSTGSGIPANIAGEYCGYNYTNSDEIISICNDVPGVFKIIRTWTVIDWCTGNIIVTGVGGEDNIQVIKVVDTIAPIITATNLSVNANVPGVHPLPCRSTAPFPSPGVTDNCSGVANVVINTQVGQIVNGNIPAPGLPIGNHIVTIQAFDNCGNVATKNIVLTVTDGIAPTPVCVEYTEVNLESTGNAEVFADAFNQASSDNCCIDHFEVRRMDNDACDDGHNDLQFGPSVYFCCEDAGKTLTVVFRAYDCFGNFNDCMVQVLVNDKLVPVLVSCPPNQRISCDWYADNIETQVASLQTASEKSQYLDQFFGVVTFYDNCLLNVTRNYSSNIDQCLEGSINRSFTATDPAGNSSVQPCNQIIFVDHVSDWAIEFPVDITINCGTTPPDFAEPEIFYETCELVAVSFEDVFYNVVPDACYKIVRTWTIINWCVVGANIDQEVIEQPENQLGLPFPQCDIDSDGDCDSRTFRDSWRSGLPTNLRRPTVLDATRNLDPDTDQDTDPWDGYITYQQTIKVVDSVDPVFVNGCAIPMVCISDNTCATDLLLPTPEVSDCSPNVTITAQIKIGGIWLTGFGPWHDVPPGMYEVIYTAMDNCNNQTVCNSSVKVKDCKKPTPYCKTGIIAGLMGSYPPMILIWASDLDDNSFDNCTTDLKFSFSADTTNTNMVFNCLDQNTTSFVDVWVTDECGNQDYCTTFITIQDNAHVCPDPLINNVSGLVTNEDDEGIENVEIHLSGTSANTAMTNSGGMYLFDNIVPGGDYTLVPSKDDDPLNGVTTFDLVLISKHILDVAPLNSPYKIIAADANKSGSVTTLDMVEIRKLILFLNDDFPNNTSWRFVEKGFNFPDPENPWASQFPEIFNINNIADDLLNTDFVGIKVGDVNGSAVVNNLIGSHEERMNGNDLTLHSNDILIEKGQTVTVPFSVAETEAGGFQFTLNFNQEKLEFVELVDGILNNENFGFSQLDKGAITSSWNSSDGNCFLFDGEIFGLTFKAKTDGSLRNMLSLDSRFTVAEAYNESMDIVDLKLVFDGQKDAENSFELHQNTPNPFSGKTYISFYLPESTNASIRFTDISGRVLKEMSAAFAKGHNEIVIERGELSNVHGVVYYRLETADFTATRMMIVKD